MQTTELSRTRLRELAGLRTPHGKVLTLYVNLDPREFATAPARSSAITAVVDEADRRARAFEGLDHDDEVALREDVERVREALGEGFDADGARGIAVFASAPAGLLAVVRLPRPVENAVHIDDIPRIDQLSVLATHERWAVALVNRRTGRILIGTREHLEEAGRADDDTSGRHDQGGWSQARYQRSIDKEAADHVRHVADELFRNLRNPGFDRLLVGCPHEMSSEVTDALHPYVRETFTGRIEVDVEHSNADAVLAAAMPAIERHEREREREFLDRLREGVASPGGHGAAGLDQTLVALYERRVGALLYEPGFTAPGIVCPVCGLLAGEGQTCPIHEQADPEEDIVERARDAALAQSAEIVAVRHHDDLGPLGRIGAVLRF
jgi:peptide chain release factor subunit 1